MKYDSSIPIYLQVVTAIKKDIVTGNIRAGDKLPSGRDLGVKYKINPNTSARVYQVLEQAGLCYTKRGLGTFVKEDPEIMLQMKNEMAEELITYFLKNMHELGFLDKEISEMIIKREN